MEGRLVLKDCSVFHPDGRIRYGMAIVCDGTTIAKVAPDAEVPVLPGDWEVACGGRLVTPGFSDCHTRLVGGQLVATSAHHLMQPLTARFELERAHEEQLTEGEVEALTAYAIARGLRQGITLFIEHLHAPRCAGPGLAAQARTAERLGARLVNSHASTSVAPVKGPELVDANAEYVERMKGHPTVRGAIGIYASFCADDETLRRAGRVKEELGCGAHVRLAESDEDLALTWEAHHTRVVTRFEKFGLLGGASVAAHARSIDRGEAERLAKTRTLIALTPRLAQTIEGGSALGMEAVLLNNNLVGLGTAGVCTLWEELASSFAGVMSLARAGRMLDPDNVMSNFLMGGPAEFNTMLFGAPSGTVEEGAQADIAVLDCVPASEAGAFSPYLLQRLGLAPVAWTIVNGRVVVREGQVVGHDYQALAREAAEAVRAVRSRVGVETGQAA